MIEHKLKNITLLEQTESKEAEELYLKMEEKYNKQKTPYLILMGIIIALGIILPSCFPENNLFFIIPIVNTLLSILIIIGINNKFNEKLKPYKRLYELTLKNDETRHQARLFYKEFKYLENKDKNKEKENVTTKNIIESNEKLKEKEEKIKSSEQLLEERIKKLKTMNLNNKNKKGN